MKKEPDKKVQTPEQEKKKLEDLNKLKAEGAAPKKERRGRKTKAEVEAEKKAEIDAQRFDMPPHAIANLLGFVFDTVAQRAGEKWILTKEEKDHGAEAINQVILKYSPAVSMYQEEIGLAMWGLAVILPRLDFKLPEVETETETKQPDLQSAA